MRIHPDHTYTTYTKHYYISSERINSKLGTINILGVLCEQMKGNDLIDEMNRRAMDAGERLEDLHTDLDKDLRLNSPYPYSPEHQFVCDFKSHNPELYDAYWYHPDHLGSSSFITNTTGEINQHMEYLPFGELLVEEHLNSYNSPFKFNAKEFDAETGNYYYGARYYDSKWSIWLSVDPLAEEFPEWSPYSYVYNNPLNYTDSTGMCPDGDCPDDVYGGELNEVVVTAPAKDRTWTSEIQVYNGTPEQYQKDYPEFAGMGDGEIVDHYEKNYGQEYRDWERKVQGEYRLGQFINKLKLGLYDTNVLDYSRVYLEVAM